MMSRQGVNSLPVSVHNPVFVDEDAEEIEPPSPSIGTGRSRSKTTTTRMSRRFKSRKKKGNNFGRRRGSSSRSSTSSTEAEEEPDVIHMSIMEMDITSEEKEPLQTASAMAERSPTNQVDVDDDVDSDEACLICMMPFSNKRNQKSQIPCENRCNANALVHPKCIYEWQARKNAAEIGSANCPLCRGPLGEVNYTPPHMLSTQTLRFETARRAFVCRPVPREVGPVRCFLRVYHHGLFSQPTFELWMQDPVNLPYPLGPLPNDRDGEGPRDVHLVAARKRMTTYGASRLDMTLDRKCKTFNRNSPDYLGTVVSSFSGLDHTVMVPGSAVGVMAPDGLQTTTAKGMFEIACVQYAQNRVGLGVGPRKMKVCLATVADDPEGADYIQAAISKERNGEAGRRQPSARHVASLSAASHSSRARELGVSQELDPEVDLTVLEDEGDGAHFLHSTQVYVPQSASPFRRPETMLNVISKGKEYAVENPNVTYAENKEPKWVENIQAYSLDFQGRVTEPSNKNFQLVTEEDDQKIVLQFGKLSHTPGVKYMLYTLDVQYPLSPLQAFGICLSCCDRKLACA